jgi:hypothetical protein
MNEALQGMMLGTYTPETAAAFVQGKLVFESLSSSFQ